MAGNNTARVKRIKRTAKRYLSTTHPTTVQTTSLGWSGAPKGVVTINTTESDQNEVRKRLNENASTASKGSSNG